MSDKQRTSELLGLADPARNAVVPPPPFSPADLMSRVDSAAGPATARPSRRLVLVAAAATVAAGAAAAAGTVLAGWSSRHSTTDGTGQEPKAVDPSVVVPIAYQISTDAPAAAPYLRKLARQIADSPYDIHSGRYTYHHTKHWGGVVTSSPEGHMQSFVIEQEIWTAADGSGRQRQKFLPPEYPDEESRRYFESLPQSPTSTTQSPDPSDGQSVLPVGPAEPPLPTDRPHLAELLGARGAPGGVAKIVDSVYSGHGIPRATRATILEILADMPGWYWRGEVTDRAGRAGVAITADEGSYQAVLVFDPRTGMLLAHEGVWRPNLRLNAYKLQLAMDRTDHLG